MNTQNPIIFILLLSMAGLNFSYLFTFKAKYKLSEPNNIPKYYKIQTF